MIANRKYGIASQNFPEFNNQFNVSKIRDRDAKFPLEASDKASPLYDKTNILPTIVNVCH